MAATDRSRVDRVEAVCGSLEPLARTIRADARLTVRDAATSIARMAGTTDSVAVLARPADDGIVVFAFPLEGSAVAMDGTQRTTLEEIRAALAAEAP